MVIEIRMTTYFWQRHLFHDCLGTNPICHCSQYRCSQRGRRPSGGCDPDVVLFPSWPQGIMRSLSRSRRAARLNLAVVSLWRTLSAGRYWTRKEDEELERGWSWWWRWRGFIWARREMRQAWFELRLGGFAMRRTRTIVTSSTTTYLFAYDSEHSHDSKPQ